MIASNDNVTQNDKQQDESYRSRRFLLSATERDFFHAMQSALDGRWLLFSKVRLADVVTCKASQWDKTPGRRIAQKHLDFVVCCPRSFRIVAVIELDDRSHDRPDRRERDSFLNRLFSKAGIPFFRYRARASYEVADMKRYWTARLPRSPNRSMKRRANFRTTRTLSR